MAVDCWSEEGSPLREQKGELVCTQPFPSRPLGFWGDSERKRYFAAYFERFAEQQVWCHGDFCEIRPTGGVVIHGRSDATLNPGGVRIGTAEIYRQVESFAGIADSIVVDWSLGNDQVIILFVKMQEQETFDAAAQQQLRRRIRQNLSPRHVPWAVYEVQDIPYTRSGKKLELAVKKALNGEQIANLAAVANPESLEHFARIGDSLRRQKGSGDGQ
jgi:acetoacetyl-CoA synthetase